MTIDLQYIPAFSIETVILDKDTGAPLSGGLVYFKQDNQRGDFKPVYQITGSSPNYTFVQLPNPMTLSSIGTFEDSLQNPVVPYFLPYDANHDPEYYYVRVTSSDDVFQFDRESVPYLNIQGSSEILSVITNEISNPQFAEVLFDTSISSTYTVTLPSGPNQVVSIAPNWDLVATVPSAGTLTVSQETPVGSSNLLTNPGTLLKINSSGILTLKLRQRLFGSPNLWGSGYLSASFVAKTYSGTVVTIDMRYSQSSGGVVDELLVSANLPANGNLAAYPGSALIPISTSNTDTFPDAYVDIYFDLPPSIEIEITSVMVAFTGATSIDDIIYDETTFDMQVNDLFHYYKPQLEYKPIPSYLTGWDFPLNPCQEFGYLQGRAVSSAGANKGYYVADQTILFQEANSNFSMTQTFNGLNLSAVADSTMAIVQYIEGQQAIEILRQRLAVKLGALSSIFPLIGTVNIYWTQNVGVPVLPDCVVTSVTNGATGPVTTVASGWTVVPRGNLGTAKFKMSASFEEFILSGFDATAVSGIDTATFVAIVISFNNITAANSVSLTYCSLNGGDIPTRPAPMSFDETLAQCQYYYEKSYSKSKAAGANSGSGAQVVQLSAQNYYSPYQVSPSTNFQYTALHNSNFTIKYMRVKRTETPTIIFYTPSGTINNLRATGSQNGSVVYDANLANTSWTINFKGDKSSSYLVTNTNSKLFDDQQSSSIINTSFMDGYLSFQYIINARLGEVV